jgi:hypothetical protein
MNKSEWTCAESYAMKYKLILMTHHETFHKIVQAWLYNHLLALLTQYWATYSSAAQREPKIVLKGFQRTGNAF